MTRAGRRSGHRQETGSVPVQAVARWLASGAILLAAFVTFHVAGGTIDPATPPPTIPGVGHVHRAPVPVPLSGTVTWSTGEDEHGDHTGTSDGHDAEGGAPEPIRERSLATW